MPSLYNISLYACALRVIEQFKYSTYLKRPNNAINSANTNTQNSLICSKRKLKQIRCCSI